MSFPRDKVNAVLETPSRVPATSSNVMHPLRTTRSGRSCGQPTDSEPIFTVFSIKRKIKAYGSIGNEQPCAMDRNIKSQSTRNFVGFQAPAL
jgi:hypothetical protein